jgi:hypothetical protein
VAVSSPSLHNFLGFRPGGFAQVDGVEVGEEALGAVAEDVLLDLDGKEGDDQ